ncbi:hypothetical protein D3C77_467770 [compost metagenome]
MYRGVILVGADDQRRTANLPDAFADAPTDNGIEAGKISAFVILRPTLGHRVPEVCLVGPGKQAGGQGLADGVKAQGPGHGPALGPPDPVAAGAALDLRCAIDDAQAAQHFRVIDGELEPHHAAHGQPHQMHRAGLQVFQQGQQVGAETCDAVALTRLVGAAVAADVHQDHPVVAGKGWHLHFPIQATGAQAVQQHQRIALAIFLVVQRATFVFEISHGRNSCQAWAGAAKGTSSGAVSKLRSNSMRICVAGPRGLSLLE